MIVQPKIRGFICTTAHPEGCTKNVEEQIVYTQQHGVVNHGPKKVLVIGASTGYGLASRIEAAFGCHAQTIGVFFERPADAKRTASAGWYNTAAFEKAAHAKGLYAKSINGDAFSDDIKQQTIDLIKKDWNGQMDLVVYSLASPRRTDPKTGITYSSVLKTIGKPFQNKNIDVFNGLVNDVTIEPATEEEIEQTVKVMGGEDWELWIDALLQHHCLAQGAMTIAYNYIGPQMTYPIYHQGTIGRAKAHLERAAKNLEHKLKPIQGKAYISVNKALVTQASSAIPIVPLYISVLYKVMKEKKLHEGCIEQIVRLFKDRLYAGKAIELDSKGFIRIDDWEMRPDVQAAVEKVWHQLNSDNIMQLSDLAGYRHEFNRLFGFDINGLDYNIDVEIEQKIPSIP
jgi:enoyl-[acyl-carrier protein] reductase/trans-2-enoyl-CoA reductase (NAD+)